MIGYIKGKVINASGGLLTLECGGIGYEINVSAHSAAELNGKNEVVIYTALIVSQDDIRLFGFSSKEEKTMFGKLTSVSGLGPKSALSVLSGLSVSELSGAIMSGNVTRLSAVKGVGKKTAERIILELKDKIGKEYALETPGAEAEILNENAGDAVMALMTLGYSRAEAERMVSKVQGELSLEQTIYQALKNA